MANHSSDSDANSVLFSLDALIGQDESAPPPETSPLVESNQIQIGQLTAPELPMLQPLFEPPALAHQTTPRRALPSWLPVVLPALGIVVVALALLWGGATTRGEDAAPRAQTDVTPARTAPLPASPESKSLPVPPDPVMNSVRAQKLPKQPEHNASPQVTPPVQRSQRLRGSSTVNPIPTTRGPARTKPPAITAPPRNATESPAKPRKCECEKHDLMCAMRCVSNR